MIAKNFRLHTEEEMIELGRKSGEMAYGIERLQGGEFVNFLSLKYLIFW